MYEYEFQLIVILDVFKNKVLKVLHKDHEDIVRIKMAARSVFLEKFE